MRCPECQEFLRVTCTTENEDGSVRRWRRCPSCGLRITTLEALPERSEPDGQDELPVPKSIPRKERTKPFSLSDMHIALRLR